MLRQIKFYASVAVEEIMQNIEFAQLKSRYFVALLLSILAQQVMVGGTVVTLALLVEDVAEGNDPWLMLILTGIFFLAPHFPAYLTKIMMSRWQVEILRAHVARYFVRFQSKPLEYGDPKTRDRAVSAASSEAYVVSQSVVEFCEGLIGGCANALFTIIPILFFIDANYGVAYAATIAMSVFFLRRYNNRIRVLSRIAQDARVALDRHIRWGWAGLTIGTQALRRQVHIRVNECIENADRLFAGREKMVALASSLVGAAALVFVLAITFWLFWRNAGDAAYLGVLVATFPRHIQIISQIIGVAQLSFSAPRLLEEVHNIQICNVPKLTQKDVLARVDGSRVKLNGQPIGDLAQTLLPQDLGPGRHLLEGPNGSGKSSFLAVLAARAGDRSYLFLPAAPGGLAPLEDNSSTGQTVLALLQTALESKELELAFLDEWYANLDPSTYSALSQKIEDLSDRITFIEVCHQR